MIMDHAAVFFVLARQTYQQEDLLSIYWGVWEKLSDWNENKDGLRSLPLLFSFSRKARSENKWNV